MKLLISVMLFLCLLSQGIAEELLVYQGEDGPGKGKHIVFLASDHEYRGEESCPALARILAKNYGFKCTVLFGVDEKGFLKAGSSVIPGMKTIEKADLLFVFARFIAPKDDDMKYFDAYIRKGGPVIGLRTSTHAFKGLKGKFARYNFRNKGAEYKLGFGRQVLGETWAGHYGHNHKCSTRIDVKKDQASHPVLTGVGSMHVQSGGYVANPESNSVILGEAQVLETMKKDSKPLKGKNPQAGIWVRTYKGDNGTEGRVFASTHGASEDILDENYRRCVINGVFWTMGLEKHIKADMNVAFVGPYNPVTFSFGGYRKNIKPLDLKGYDTPILGK
jgi:hypothetical protein